MTSVIRSVAKKQEGLTKFLKVNSACYLNEDNDDTLFPFIYYNNTLDITYDGNNFKQEMVDISGRAPSDYFKEEQEIGADEEANQLIRILGGTRLVTAVGENFKAYIRAWRAETIDVNSPIEVYIPSQIIRVQSADSQNLTSTDSDIYRISTVAPAGDNYISGTVTTGYDTTYVFKTPLTFTIIEGGVKKYITFNSTFDQE